MTDKLLPFDISNQLHITDFIYSLMHKQRNQFACCMKYAMESTEKSCFAASSHKDQPSDKYSCTMPVSYPILRSTYTNGTKAVIPNLPCPEVKSHVSHSYMSLEHIVLDHLALSV